MKAPKLIVVDQGVDLKEMAVTNACCKGSQSAVR